VPPLLKGILIIINIFMIKEIPPMSIVGPTTEEFRQACIRSFEKYKSMENINVSALQENLVTGGRNYTMMQFQWDRMPDGRPSAQLQHKNEIYALGKNWVVDDEDIQIIRNHIDQYFNAYHCFRLLSTLPGIIINDVIYKHIFPRVIVPIYNDETEYILFKNGKKHSLIYKVGNMYLWDCRQAPHHVINHSKTQGRLAANFWIDLSKETKMTCTLPN